VAGGRRGDLKTGRWKRIRETVLKRDNYDCQIRGPRCTEIATTVDHIVPHAHGGDDSYGNLRAACHRCNSTLGARTRGAGFLSPRSTPAPPAFLSLAEPRESRTERRTHRVVP
jgi:5-methylcytosine-specific restriction endonuclease McrA